MRYITFGEIMLRLKAHNNERFFQTPVFEASFGGGEANVAVSLSNYGEDVSFFTILPENEIADICIKELRGFGVDTSKIIRNAGRMGIYYLENGVNQKPSKVVYDRDYSSISITDPYDINWNDLLKGFDWYHVTGITPAISDSARILTLNSVKAAKALGLSISFDLNYRSKLWKYGRKSIDVIPELVEYVDVLIANEEDIQKSLGLNSDLEITKSDLELDKYNDLCKTVLNKYPNLELVAITLRESINANHNMWSGCLGTKDSFFVSKKYDIWNIVDRVGGGDSFAAGLIYGLNHYKSHKDSLEFAVAASCLKHSILGDYNRVNVEEVETLMNGNGNGRVQR